MTVNLFDLSPSEARMLSKLVKLAEGVPFDQRACFAFRDMSNAQVNACRMLVYRGYAEAHSSAKLTMSFRLTERGRAAHEKNRLATSKKRMS